GTAVHYHLRLATGERVIAYRQNDAAPAVALATGSDVVVSWEPGTARLLPEESGERDAPRVVLAGRPRDALFRVDIRHATILSAAQLGRVTPAQRHGMLLSPGG